MGWLCGNYFVLWVTDVTDWQRCTIFLRMDEWLFSSEWKNRCKQYWRCETDGWWRWMLLYMPIEPPCILLRIHHEEEDSHIWLTRWMNVRSDYYFITLNYTISYGLWLPCYHTISNSKLIERLEFVVVDGIGCLIHAEMVGRGLGWEFGIWYNKEGYFWD